jgi:hypothetical protein
MNEALLVSGEGWHRPGEISVVHRRAPSLDELPEFGKRTLDVLTQSIEEKQVTIEPRPVHSGFNQPPPQARKFLVTGIVFVPHIQSPEAG